MALSLALLGIMSRFTQTGAPMEEMAYFLISAGLTLVGFLLIPSAAYALMRLIGKNNFQQITLDGFILPLAIVVILPVALLAGYWLSGNDAIAWIILPPLHILAIGLPVLFITFLGVRGISIGTPQRAWGIFASGAVVGPLIIFTLEIMAFIALVALGMVWLSSQPGWQFDLLTLSRSLQQSQTTPEELARTLTPLVSKPEVILAAFAFIAVIVPLIEELVKPIGVWLLAGTRLTPAAGFTAGILSGAGYALIESLGLASSGEGWAALVIARIGTASVHIFTSGLSGWALALAWRERRFLRLGATYLFNVLVHGLWNAFTLTIVIATFPRVGKLSSSLARLGEIAPYVLVGLTLLSFMGLIAANRRLYRSQLQVEHAESSGIIPPIVKENNGTTI